jgi:hypothetical protein
MKIIIIAVAVCILTGCSTTGVENSQWTSCTAIDQPTGKATDYLNLNGLLMEWSSARNGFGYLYLSAPPLLDDKVWTFPGRTATATSTLNPSIYVADGDVVTAVHISGRKFEIKIITQTDTYIKVNYREIK